MSMHDNLEDNSEETEYVSKTQMKRECGALQKLGEELIALKSQELEQMHLPDQLAEAVSVARKLNARSGLKRQKQYIGKIMRELDSDSIKQQLDRIRHRHDINNAAFKKTEHWRDKLISDGHDAVTAILNEYPEMERQHLNQLVRQAQKEASQNKPPTASRKLFLYLREVIDPQD